MAEHGWGYGVLLPNRSAVEFCQREIAKTSDKLNGRYWVQGPYRHLRGDEAKRYSEDD